MNQEINTSGLPEVIVGDVDYDRLSGLATAALGRMPDVAASLLFELERATILETDQLPANVVRLGSTVAFQTDAADVRRVCLVVPGGADIAAGRVSILTPIGAALIGLSEGQSIMWSARDGKRHRLTVIAVEPSVCAEQ